jgi:uncharacterized protein (TIGR00725 family)
VADRPLRITVVGGGRCDTQTASDAERVGAAIARGGGVLISGGLGGVMEAASRGARGAGGTTIGVLPGERAEDANEFVEIPIVTGMGQARNIVNVLSGEALVALTGEGGTLSEIAVALKSDIPIIAVNAWHGIDGVRVAETPEQAVDIAMELARARRAQGGPS